MGLMNKCIRKSSIETSIRELEEMKDRDYTVISNYIKDVISTINYKWCNWNNSL